MDLTKDAKEEVKKEELVQEVKEAPVEDVKPAADEKATQQTDTASDDKAAAASSTETSEKKAPVADPPVSEPSAAAQTSDTTPEAASTAKTPEAAAAAVTAAAVTAAATAAKEIVAEATAAPPAVPSETSKNVQAEEFSDPDEDDLDDLDDMLDEFSAAKIDTKTTVEATPGSSDASKKPATAGKQPAAEDDFSEEEFAKQLQAGMADLLGELEGSPDMQAQFEDIFKQIAAAEGTDDAPPPPPTTKAGSAPQPSTEDASFQETIRKTMERMQASGDQATAAAASGAGDDFMSEILKQMSSGGMGDLGGEGSEEEFSKMLMGMMEQLTNKEILYEPMKELDEKFPEWLTKNREKTSKEDLKRYEEQQSVVREIVAKFEEKTYSDSNTADREFIVDRMQKMQAAGSPPADLVGDMPSAQEALNPSDEACNPQ